ncbi:MAG: PTS fructose transporter subunit IIC [Bacilli bacterium]
MAVKKREALTSTKPSTQTNNALKPSFRKEASKHMMTGISNMIPFLIMGGLILAFSQLILYVILKLDPSTGVLDALNTGTYEGFNLSLLKFAYLSESFGGVLFGFAIPMFAAFTANSIGGKLAFPAGFIGGIFAAKPIAVLSIIDGSYQPVAPVASGFIGAFIIAFLAGYLVKYLNKTIKVNNNWLAFKSTFLIPVLAALFVMFSMYYIITPFGGLINNGMKEILTAAGDTGQIVYAMVLSQATAIDLGGPINKAAGFVALPLTTDHILPITARTIAIVVPSIGLGLATILDRSIVGRRVFDSQFYPQGKTAIFLAFMGISEGAIPFALEKPKLAIPSYMIGALVGSTSGVLLGAVQWFPESAVWVWPLITNFWAYAVGIILGSLTTALLTIFLRNNEIKKGRLVINE